MYLDMFDDLFENIVPWEREGDASSKITVDDIPRSAILDVSKPWMLTFRGLGWGLPRHELPSNMMWCNHAMHSGMICVDKKKLTLSRHFF